MQHHASDKHQVAMPLNLLKHCDNSLQVSEVWIVHEPIPQVNQAIGSAALKKATQAAVKHYFLVFVLERGEMMYGYEFQYMRVERQQQVPAGGADESQALLNIRFCRDPIIVQGLDVPGKNAWELTEDDLRKYGITLSEKRSAQILRKGSMTDPRLSLGRVIKALLNVHKSNLTYKLSGANCIGFVDEVLSKLAAASQELNTLLRAFRSGYRFFLAEAVQPLMRRWDIVKLIAGWDGTGLASLVLQPASVVHRTGSAAAASSALSSVGVVTATIKAFQGRGGSS